ncbi:MAG TPA: SET domain-containing protein-lysine N-methyltransferase [Candidatus Saccharimonadales bacterium]|nr:SET domain-containing protein-lysine N-methyltransferase [Candidatus Saccharimonadales bacterium]
MSSLKKLLISLCFISFALVAKQYVPSGNQENVYVTSRQKQKFFKSLGCHYTNTMEINFPQFGEIKPRQTNSYKEDSKEIEALSKKYEKDIKDRKLAPMYIKWISPEIGYGIFASRDIVAGEFIGVYAGQLRQVQMNGKTPDDTDYAWYYSCDTHDGKKLIIDGKYRGNELRFINHATNPNTKKIDTIVDDCFYVCYVAQKDIARDKELSVSYGDGYWTTRNKKPNLIQ